VETTCVKVQLKPGSLDRVRAWAAELERRGEEVLATLRDERVVVESVFLDRTGNGDFLIYYLKAWNVEEAREAARQSQHDIDAYHDEFKNLTQ
jgi:hypothetical protein